MAYFTHVCVDRWAYTTLMPGLNRVQSADMQHKTSFIVIPCQDICLNIGYMATFKFRALISLILSSRRSELKLHQKDWEMHETIGSNTNNYWSRNILVDGNTTFEYILFEIPIQVPPTERTNVGMVYFTRINVEKWSRTAPMLELNTYNNLICTRFIGTPCQTFARKPHGTLMLPVPIGFFLRRKLGN